MSIRVSGHLLLMFAIGSTCGFLLDPTTTATTASTTATTATAQCADSDSLDCPTVNRTTNLCANVQIAIPMCPKFCGYCNIQDGQWTTWTAWSDCDVTCANGTHIRIRTCTNPPPTKPYGKDCVGSGQEVQPCHNAIQCPINGEWGQWSSWFGCSKTCDVGMQRRDRHCDNPYPSLHGDHCFGEPIAYRICSERACADGGWSPWGQWSTCSVTCGDGFRTRDRLCDSPTPSMLGKQCSGNSQMVTHCTNKHCAVNGEWGQWSVWGSCSQTCGVGLTRRDRHCDNPYPAAHGDHCFGEPIAYRTCMEQACADVQSAFFVSGPRSIISEKLTFSRTLYTDGGDFNASTGLFTCSIPGVYHFSVSLTKKRSSSSRVNQVYCVFYLNDVDYLYIAVNPWDDDTDKGSASVSNFAILHLNRNDTVSLRGCSNPPTSYMENWSSFTGFLMYADP